MIKYHHKIYYQKHKITIIIIVFHIKTSLTELSIHKNLIYQKI